MLTHALPDLVCQGNSFRTLKEVTMIGNTVEWHHSSMRADIASVGSNDLRIFSEAVFLHDSFLRSLSTLIIFQNPTDAMSRLQK